MARLWTMRLKAGTFLLVGLALTASARAADLDPAEIMRRSFMVGRVSDSRATVTMTLTNARGTQRARATLTLTKLLPNGVDQKRLVRFRSPAEVKGTATLLVEHADGEDDIWIYLPALRKVRRLVATNKKDSFVGTDFSYGDIIGHRVDDWRYTLVTTEQVDGAETYVIEAEPRNDEVRENSGYARRRVWIRADNFVAVKGRFWDTGGSLLKEMDAHDVRQVDAAHEKWQPFQLRMQNRQTGHVTEFLFTKLEVGVGLGDDLFTERNLEKED
jgi:uncharacterized protein